MNDRIAELEAQGSAGEVIDGYDPASDSWRFSFDSPFWKAAKHAHSLGAMGAGQEIVILDSGCDRRLPRLQRTVASVTQFVDATAEEGRSRHGTAVSLLISEIAPEARIHVYRVVEKDGTVNLDAIISALGAASKSDARAINLSLASPRALEPTSEAPPDPLTDPDNFKRVFCREEPECELCAASKAAANAGKLVFASVGNSVIDIYCPARADDIIAVGFQRLERIEGPGGMVEFGLPVLNEAPYADLFVQSTEGILGSSFASPLFAGVGALGLTQTEARQYISSIGESVFPKLWHSRIDMSGGPAAGPPADLVAEVHRRYTNTLSRLPHAHCAIQTKLRPDLTLTDPSTCALCGFFAEPQFVKFGMWLYEFGYYDQAIQLLETATAFAPWSAEANAYLGMTFHQMEDARQALYYYGKALELRPNYPMVLQCLQNLMG